MTRMVYNYRLLAPMMREWFYHRRTSPTGPDILLQAARTNCMKPLEFVWWIWLLTDRPVSYDSGLVLNELIRWNASLLSVLQSSGHLNFSIRL